MTPAVSIVTIVTPADENRHVKAGLEGILSQTFGDLELLVVDAGGNGGAKALVESFDDPRIKLIEKKSPGGSKTGLLNEAVRLAAGEFIAPTGPGDLSAPNRLEELLGLMQSDERLGLVGSWSDVITTGGSTHDALSQPELEHRNIIRHLLAGDEQFAEGSVMFRKASYEEVGGFDEILESAAQYDLTLRIGENHLLAGLDKCLFQKRVKTFRSARRLKVGKYYGCLKRKVLHKAAPPAPREGSQAERDLARHRFMDRVEGRVDYLETLKYSLARYPLDDILYERFEAAFRSRYGRTTNGEDYVFFKTVSCLKYEQDEKHLNDLVEYYRLESNPRLAFLCSLKSLDINPEQPDIYATVKQYMAAADAHVPQLELADGDSCAVSVIMPTYKRSDTVRESIESVLAQTFGDLELIIVNDGGPDEIGDIVSEFKSDKIKYFKYPHKGLAGALNEGLMNAGGKYVCYVDDDDILYPDHVEKLHTLISEKQAGLVYSKSILVKGHYEEGRFVRERELGTYTEKYSRRRLHQGCIISTLNVMHQRQALATTGVFNEYLPWSMDWDLWVRFSDNFEIEHLPEYTGEYRLTHDNMTVSDYYKASFYISILLSSYYLSNHGLAILARAASACDDYQTYKSTCDQLVGGSDIISHEYISKLLQLRSVVQGPQIHLGPRLLESEPYEFVLAVFSNRALLKKHILSLSLIRKIPSLLFEKSFPNDLKRLLVKKLSG